MAPEGYSAITVPDEVFEQVTEVMIEYDCDSIANAVEPHRLSHSNMMKQFWLNFSLNDSPNRPQNRTTVPLQ